MNNIIEYMTINDFKNNGLEGARNYALQSEEYKNSPYKIGDKVHVSDNGYENDCTISDAYLVYNMELKPVIKYIVRLEDGNERALHDTNCIQYKL